MLIRANLVPYWKFHWNPLYYQQIGLESSFSFCIDRPQSTCGFPVVAANGSINGSCEIPFCAIAVSVSSDCKRDSKVEAASALKSSYSIQLISADAIGRCYPTHVRTQCKERVDRQITRRHFGVWLQTRQSVRSPLAQMRSGRGCSCCPLSRDSQMKPIEGLKMSVSQMYRTKESQLEGAYWSPSRWNLNKSRQIRLSG